MQGGGDIMHTEYVLDVHMHSIIVCSFDLDIMLSKNVWSCVVQSELSSDHVLIMEVTIFRATFMHAFATWSVHLVYDWFTSIYLEVTVFL